MASPTPTRTLAAWAAEVPPIDDPVALERARLAIHDIFACVIAGAGDVGTERLRRAIEPMGAGPAAVVGAIDGAPAPSAALVNGFAAHALDFDDNFLPGLTHPTAVLGPALLALGETLDCSGAALLDAYVVGLEVQAAIGRGVNRDHHDMGWHSTGTVGRIGAAAACARLLGLDVDGMTHALSLGVSMAAGVKVQFGTMGKPLHAGLAARDAITAAHMARAGIELSPAALDGRFGFRALFAAGRGRGWSDMETWLGRPLAIVSDGLAPKRFPCCGSAHRALDMLLDLRRDHGFSADDVRRIRVEIALGNRRNLMYDDPRDEREARFSMPYCLAVALVTGRVTLADFTPRAVRRAALGPVMRRVEIAVIEPALEPREPKWRPLHRLEVELRDGRIHRASAQWERGTIHDPFDRATLDAKFADCCRHALDDPRRAALAHDLDRLAELPSVRSLTAALRFAGGADRGERFEEEVTR